MEKVIIGIDLHSNNVVMGITDQEGKRLASKKVACSIVEVAQVLAPYRERLEAMAVESTYNWYWLVDGLEALGYSVVLANPAGMQQYSGIKHADDTNDAFFLADLLRLKILPTGYIYAAELRPVRDLLRRRMMLVGQRTALMLSFKSQYTRTTGKQLSLARLKTLEMDEARSFYDHPADQLIAGLQITQIEQLNQSIKKIEKMVLGAARALPCFDKLEQLPGIGRILGMTIALEVGTIQRFATAGNFASYCRAVQAQRTSNSKKKGENNSKCGNKYLGWAFVEAANFARRYDEQCRRWYDRKAAQSSNVIATKALACKLAKAAWHVMSQNTDFNPERVFGKMPAPKTNV